MRTISRFLPPLAACMFLAFTLLTSQGGCSLSPLTVECYRCPCGSPEYGCVGGRCLLLSTINSLTPQQLTQYVIAKCQQPLVDGGTQDQVAPPDTPSGCNCQPNEECDPVTKQCKPKQPPSCQNCKPGEECDKATGQCKPTPCPDGQPRRPDGTCPPKDLCDGKACPGGESCDPKTGQCVKVSCDPKVCPPPNCCHPIDGTCIESCLVCGGCPTGYRCNDESRCVKAGNTCRGKSSCSDTRSCCGRTCVRALRNGGSGRYHRSCDCANDEQCPLGRKCVQIASANGARKMCSCENDSECGAGGRCESASNSRVCTYRR